MTNSRPAKHTVVMMAKAEFLVFVCLFIWTRWFESQLYVIDRSLDSSGTVTACQVSTEAPGVQWVPLDDVIVLGNMEKISQLGWGFGDGESECG